MRKSGRLLSTRNLPPWPAVAMSLSPDARVMWLYGKSAAARAYLDALMKAKKATRARLIRNGKKMQ